MSESILLQPLFAVSEQLRRGEISSAELVELTLSRIERLNPRLHALIRVSPESARETARLLDAELRRGQWRGPLHGVPVTVKDILATKGQITTGGSQVLRHWVPDRDAVAVQRLREAGAVIVGKANLHEFAMGATTENPYYGNAKNPWNLDLIPGGSSGGSAVAVATGMGYASLGSDTAGSIRLPAAMCGIVGLKPTYDLVERDGCLPFSWSLDHVGPMARRVEDVRLLLDALVRPDHPRRPRPSGQERGDLSGLRIGLVRGYGFEAMDEEMAAVGLAALEVMTRLGARRVELELPHLAEAENALRTIAQAEAWAFHAPIYRRKPELYGADVRYRLQFGQQVTAEAYVNAQRMRRRFLQAVLEGMRQVDVWCLPTNIRPPFRIGSVPPEQAINNMFTLGRTPLANLLGFPALTIPVGFTRHGLPCGLQLIGPAYSDWKLLAIAKVIEEAIPSHQALIENRRYEAS
ncbi:MAG: amidase [Firmicutes bacterium]|nr:amidase [Bacillota bacterium]